MLENDRRKGKKDKQKHVKTERERYRGKQAVEDWDPGLGVVWWAVVAGERVVWSGALDVGE